MNQDSYNKMKSKLDGFMSIFVKLKKKKYKK
jgi:hypothetical protein